MSEWAHSTITSKSHNENLTVQVRIHNQKQLRKCKTTHSSLKKHFISKTQSSKTTSEKVFTEKWIKRSSLSILTQFGHFCVIYNFKNFQDIICCYEMIHFVCVGGWNDYAGSTVHVSTKYLELDRSNYEKFQNFLFQSLNCHFWERIKRIITRVDSFILKILDRMNS